MTNANECTCPSGDGSLRHPCPAHPASVELAGVAANLTFINGRPAMCGCQVEYSSGGGEYSDVIYVTLCAKHSGSAILDLVATNRIALTPEYEGQWHADLYLDREIPLAKADGATPAEAVLALMSAERIDPEQESVEQAGEDERVIGWRERILAAHPNSDPGFWPDALLVEHMAAEIADLRAALAQLSPASDLDPLNLAPHVEAFNEAPAEALKPEQAEAERPEVVAWRYGFSGGIVSDKACLDEWKSGGEYQSLMTVAQHERIAGALRFERQQMDRAFTACINERDAANARLHEVATACATAEQERDAALAEVERLRQFERICEGLPQDAIDGGWTVQGIRGYAKRLEDQLKSALARVAELEKQEPVGWANFRDGRFGAYLHRTEDDARRFDSTALAGKPAGSKQLALYAAPVAQDQQLHDLDKQCRDDVARALGLRPSQERGFAWSYLLASIKSCVKASEDAAQAQHSVPDGYRLIRLEHFAAIKAQLNPEQVDAYRGRNIYDEDKVYANWNACRSALDEIKDVFQQIDWDAENELAELLAAAPGKEVGHE